MYLKALEIDAADLVCSASPRPLAATVFGQTDDDPLLDLAAAALIRRGPLSAAAVADLVERVHRAQALIRWRGQGL